MLDASTIIALDISNLIFHQAWHIIMLDQGRPFINLDKAWYHVSSCLISTSIKRDDSSTPWSSMIHINREQHTINHEQDWYQPQSSMISILITLNKRQSKMQSPLNTSLMLFIVYRYTSRAKVLKPTLPYWTPRQKWEVRLSRGRKWHRLEANIQLSFTKKVKNNQIK